MMSDDLLYPGLSQNQKEDVHSEISDFALHHSRWYMLWLLLELAIVVVFSNYHYELFIQTNIYQAFYSQMNFLFFALLGVILLLDGLLLLALLGSLFSIFSAFSLLQSIHNVIIISHLVLLINVIISSEVSYDFFSLFFIIIVFVLFEAMRKSANSTHRYYLFRPQNAVSKTLEYLESLSDPTFMRMQRSRIDPVETRPPFLYNFSWSLVTGAVLFMIVGISIEFIFELFYMDFLISFFINFIGLVSMLGILFLHLYPWREHRIQKRRYTLISMTIATLSYFSFLYLTSGFFSIIALLIPSVIFLVPVIFEALVLQFSRQTISVLQKPRFTFRDFYLELPSLLRDRLVQQTTT